MTSRLNLKRLDSVNIDAGQMPSLSLPSLASSPTSPSALSPSALPISRSALPNSYISTNSPLVSIQSPISSVYIPNKTEVNVLSPSVSSTESIMKTANPTSPIEMKSVKKSLENVDKVIDVDNKKTKVLPSPTSAEFSTFRGVSENQDIEKALLERGFISLEKILTRNNENVILCQFVKARDNLGHHVYIELDTTCKDGFGYLNVSSTDPILEVSTNASVIPYSLKIGTFEATTSNLHGIAFECDGNVCVMSRKDKTLNPKETVFTVTDDKKFGVQLNHPVAYPIVKFSEILINPGLVHENIQKSHNLVRNIAFESSMRDVNNMLKNTNALEREIKTFGELSNKISTDLHNTITELENYYSEYMARGITNSSHAEKLKTIKFNLAKRNELLVDYISLCHSMRERSHKVAVLTQEIADINVHMKNLFSGINSILIE